MEDGEDAADNSTTTTPRLPVGGPCTPGGHQAKEEHEPPYHSTTLTPRLPVGGIAASGGNQASKTPKPQFHSTTLMPRADKERTPIQVRQSSPPPGVGTKKMAAHTRAATVRAHTRGKGARAADQGRQRDDGLQVPRRTAEAGLRCEVRTFARPSGSP